MKKLGSLLHFLLTSILVSVSLLLSSTVSLGETSGTTAPVMGTSSQSTDCQLSPNPDKCYYEQTQQKWTPLTTSVIPNLNSSMLGLEGPFSAELKYDSTLSWILGLNYIQMIGESVGLSTKLTGGPNELRANVTAGYALTKDQQIKLTYEYLTQNLPFDFASGSVDEWVSQQSLGVAYQYVLHHEILHSLELSGYTTRAASQDLSSIAFNQQTVVAGTTYSYDENFRRIAGGSENTILGSANLFPFADLETELTLGAGYSEITYDTYYQNDSSYNSNNGIAYKAELTHLLSPKTKVSALVNSTAALTESDVRLSHILPHHFEASLTGQYIAGQAGMQDDSSVILSLTYPAPESYKLGGFGKTEEFRNWVEKPIVYSSRVLAIKDELVQRYEYSTTASLSDQTKLFGEMLTPVATVDHFRFTQPSVQVTYTVLTQKINPKMASGSGSVGGKDYTRILNLRLVPAGNNQAILQSGSNEGFPDIDADKEDTSGTYQMTITAIGLANGASPMVLTNGFKLTIAGKRAPVWHATSIPNANIGKPYPEVDLNKMLKFYSPDKAIIIENDDALCTHPAWLDLVTCSADSSHQCLSSGGKDVPASADTPFSVCLKATGNVSGLSASQKLNSEIPNTNLAVNWVDNALLTPAAGEMTYSKPLNEMGLLETKNAGTVVSDTYNYTLTKSSDPNWKVVNNNLQYKTGAEALPAEAGAVRLVLTATNTNPLNPGVKPTSGGDTSDTHQKTFTLKINVVSTPLWANTQAGSIKFDTTGDDAELGAVADGIKLNAMISNTDKFDANSIEIQWDPEAGKPENWDIKKDEAGNYRLLRGKGNGGYTVDASDVGKTVTVPARMQVCAKTGGATRCALSGKIESDSEEAATIKVAVLPDPGIVYKINDERDDDSPSFLTAATSDGLGGHAIGVPQTAFPQPLYGKRPRVYTSGKFNTYVLGDSEVTYLKPASAPGYVNYAALPDKISFVAPNGSEYQQIVTNPDTTYISAESNANGRPTVPVAGNVKRLKPITAMDLILVPYRNANNTPYDLNGGKNIGVGINNIEGSNCSWPAAAHFTATTLTFSLPTPPAGKSYYLKQVKTSGTSSSGTYLGGVCKGNFQPTGPQSFCSTQTYNAKNLVPQSGAICGGQQVAAGAIPGLPNYTAGTYKISDQGGTFTLFVGGNGLSDGKNIPASYDNMGKTALMIGKNYGDYSDFPVVTLK